ncbi:hypothetical protein [Fluviicola taffensis]|uniref:Uncharacterized protein n=1 Tax=Fluviicola taffensis (strain DSM 16823 / NCIMB 13979 / RW262) TaxID=755732 RepID=F2IH71_FLUTR|nr:hypothetical protein [Fluviicola taffensis]AEA42626.1 hypothetical protein Fluta_0622 [Fluviicola taffensis DSM 16823]
MKRIFYSVLTVLSMSFITNAQDVSPIFKKPANANGYLIMNQAAYPSVTNWKVSIKQRVWNTSLNRYEYTLILSKTLLGLNYFKVPKEYRNSNYVVDIRGNSNTGTVIQTNDIGMGPVTETMCNWVCNGPNYVYGLQMNNVPFQGVKISMQPASAPTGTPFYYEWVQDGYYWNQFLNNQNPADYGFSSWDHALEFGGDAIIEMNVPPGQYKYDRFGTPMNGAVVGVSKYFGPYKDVWNNVVSDPLMVLESDCSNPISWAIDLVNDGSTNPVTVACNGNSGPINWSSTNEVLNPISFDPCFEEYYDEIGWHAGSGSGVYQLVQIPCNWFVTNPGGGTGAGVNWPENVSRITMKSMNSKSGLTEISFAEDDVFDNRGRFIGANYPVPAGFYTVIYQYSDLSIASYYVEVPTATNSVISEKDFLSYSAYPVPIVENRFSMSFNATKKVSFRYELRNASNELLFKDDYIIEKDASVTRVINVPEGIPTGVLYNKFRFSDGSVIQFTTIK